MNISAYLQQLIGGKDLSEKQAFALVRLLTSAKTTPAQIGGILSALSGKGETSEEITGLILGMRGKMQRITASPTAVDVCGTGGDGKQTFNISTAVAFVLAGIGVSVAKHGNRAASSLCGSADVLEALGIHIQLTPREAENILKTTGMVFLFAPLYHRAFKQVGVVRKELGIRTVFNLLGPFASPAGVKRQVIGIPNKKTAHMLAQVARRLSYTYLCIVVSEDGMDEISLFAKTYVYEIKGSNVRRFVIDPRKYGFLYSSISAIHGASAQINAAIIENVLSGRKGAPRDIVVLNSALGCIVSGRAKTMQEGITLSEESLDSGKARKVLETLRKETKRYASHA
ncbi:MAG: anthranilate phosphoribosyltransferase [Patescibacteria group bacterium]|nr:anthranilate phosphoribosyltransferase [Patescibacteria group bacterium]